MSAIRTTARAALLATALLAAACGGEVVRDPAMLATLATSHGRLRPQDPQWLGIRVVQRSYVLKDRAPTGEVTEEILAQWDAS